MSLPASRLSQALRLAIAKANSASQIVRCNRRHARDIVVLSISGSQVMTIRKFYPEYKRARDVPSEFAMVEK
jgi:hypothetical protein